jgi:transposase InsO family protein
MLVVVDYYSRYMKVSFLRSKDKDSVVPALTECIESFEKDTGKLVRRLRTDGGTEFVNGDMTEYAKRKHIKHQVTVRDSPQTNGQVERCNRYLVEKIRVQLLHAGLPDSLWAEVASSTAKTLNHVPVSSNENKTPYCALFNRNIKKAIFPVIGALVIGHKGGYQKKLNS